ncbi:MAG: hypothetical protein ABSH48_23665 [Verrucomicrobiota bacterium]|jgi:hypothetical protein
MMEIRLRHQLRALESIQRKARLRRALARCWAATAAAGLLLFLVRGATGWDTRAPWGLALAGGLAAAGIVWRRERRRPVDLRAVAAAIEREHPQIRHLLTTAAEQQPDPDSGEFKFLQLRVIEQVLTHPHQDLWTRGFKRELKSAATAQMIALAALVVALGLEGGLARWHTQPGTSWLAEEITVAPGDTQVERGTGLVVTARFARTPPAEAALVVMSASGKTKRIPMARQLADPVFGASLPDIAEAGLYRVEYGAHKTRDFKIGIYDYPALTRADADLEYPAYTDLTNQTIRDTLRVSAVEGTRLTYTLLLNKSVVHARFLGRTETLDLEVQTNPVARLGPFPLTHSAEYALELVDADGRTNKFPANFSLVALPDRPPEVKLTFPHGDQRVSSLEELQLEGEAKAEFGLLKYGIGYSVAGQEPQIVALGEAVPAEIKCRFTNQIALEQLGMTADQVVSYFAWADDHGPDGQVRRTFSDMFFAEIRPFDEIFRADQSGASENQNRSQGGNQATQLADLEKQIVIATWKLHQEKEGVTSARLP